MSDQCHSIRYAWFTSDHYKKYKEKLEILYLGKIYACSYTSGQLKVTVNFNSV